MKLLKLRKLKRIWKKSAKRLGFGGLKKIAVVVLLVGLNWAGIAAIGQTAGYFNDEENSSGNAMMIGTLDFSLASPADFSPNVTPTQVSSRTINVVKDGALDFGYKVSANNLSGDLCDVLNLSTTFNGNLYSGPIAGFNNFDAGEFDTVGGDWQFTATLIGDDPSLQGQICTFDFVFDGTQIGGTGFSDSETIQSTVRVSYWDPPVVLNEFLPNAGDYPEFVEIYNKTDSPIDLNGFYIKANDSVIPINTTTTADYSGSDTTIPANGWLVITTGGDLINNGSGTIALYNGNDVLVDSYAYGSPDQNVNNTPGSTNNLVAYLPFNNDLLDKSGNNNNGTNNGTTFSSGKIEQGLTLGSSNYIEVPDSPSLDITDKITLEAWVYPTAWTLTYENSILTKAGNGDYGVWNLHHKTTAKGFRFELNNGSSHALFESTPSTTLNVWYHVVGVYDGNEMKLYVNGVLKGSLATSGSIATNDSPLRIGKQFWWGTNYSYWTGKIDEVKIYNRALDATEVLEHYSAVSSSGNAVPVDKSYARIPDGTGAWVDPMPTPGGPNKLVKIGEDILDKVVVENVAENTASLSFSETLGAVAGAITEFVLGEEETVASTSTETVVDVPDLAPLASGSVEPLVEPLSSPEASPEVSPSPESSPEPSVTPEPTVTPAPSTDSLQAGDGNLIQTVTEPAIPAEPVIIEAPTEPAPPPADPPAPAPEQAPAPAPEAPSVPAE